MNLWEVTNLYVYVLSVIITIRGGLVESHIRLVPFLNGSNSLAKLGSSFNFSWNYDGNIRRIEWGTKRNGVIALNTLLFVLDTNGPLTPNVSQYDGRRFGSWNQRSPGQVVFTLKPIKEVDNQSFIFRFVSNDPVAPDAFDMVQLIVKGPPVVEIIPPALSILRGATASFTCNSEGFPLPNIVWMKQTSFGERELSANRGDIQIYYHNGSSELIVQNTSTADAGYFICKASNYVSDTARAFLGVVYPASYEEPYLCPTSFDATRGESVLMCCPFQGFPPPQVTWELPNGTPVETGSTILHVTVETENDFGRYRCIARNLEKNVLTVDIAIRKRIPEPCINDTRIILTDDVEFVWEEVQGATYYLLRLPETTFLWENSLLGNGTKTSVEIPYSSLPFKSDTEKIPLKVVIEVWAYGNSKIIGNGTRYINVEIRAGVTTSTVSLMTLLLSFVICTVQ